MKRILSFLLLSAIATGALPSTAYAFQSVTYPLENSGNVVAVTLNYDTQTVTWHYSDGSQFTQANVDFKAVARWVEQKNVEGN